MTMSATRAADKTDLKTKSGDGPCRANSRANRAAVEASTRGYCGEMDAPQWRQRPRSSAYDTTGTLSYQAIGRPHAVQAERGRTTETRRGRRWMQTFTNEPITAPSATTKNQRTATGMPSLNARGPDRRDKGPAPSPRRTSSRAPRDPAAGPAEGRPGRFPAGGAGDGPRGRGTGRR